MTQIQEGVDTLNSQGTAGIRELLAGFKSLSDGASQVSAGVTNLVSQTKLSILSQVGDRNGDGSVTYADITDSLAAITAGTGCSSTSDFDAKISELNNTITTLQALPADTIIDTNGTTAAMAIQAATDGVVTYSTYKANFIALTTAKTSYDSIVALDQGAQSVSAGAAELASNETSQKLTGLTDGLASLQTGVNQVKTGTSTLKTGVGTLGSGTSQLQSGSQTLTEGLGTLSSASTQVNDALGTLKTGTQAAYDGSLQLTDGIQQLKDGIDEGIDGANEQIDKLDGLSDFVKDSVEIEEVDYGEIEAYGTAFTPLFISVGLWVGALMAYVVFYYDQEKRFKILGKQAKNKYLQSFCYLGIAIIQAIVTGFLLDLGLDMNITNYGLYYGSCILISITFMSIVQFLILNFGEVGKMMGLLILVLQLASSGGTFPVALIDEGFQKLTQYLPMTYTIKLTKEAVILREPGNAGHDIAIMMGYTVVCVAITFIVQKCKKIYNKKKDKEAEANA